MVGGDERVSSGRYIDNCHLEGLHSLKDIIELMRRLK